MRTLVVGLTMLVLCLGCGDQVTVTSGVCDFSDPNGPTACSDGLTCCSDNICRGTCAGADGSMGPPEDIGHKDGGAKDSGTDTGEEPDSGSVDVGGRDTGTEDVLDAGPTDQGYEDALDGGSVDDTGTVEDTGPTDTGTVEDTGPVDTGVPDAGSPDAGSPDTGSPDTGSPDSGTPDAGGDPCANYTCPPNKICEVHSGNPACVEGCLTDADCSSDRRCDQTHQPYVCYTPCDAQFKCVLAGDTCKTIRGAPVCVPECVAETDCYPRGQNCIDHKCVVPSCTKDAECWGDLAYCDTRKGECGWCRVSDNAGCITGRVCSSYVEPTQCVAVIPNLCKACTCPGGYPCDGGCGANLDCDAGKCQPDVFHICQDASKCGGLDCLATDVCTRCP